MLDQRINSSISFFSYPIRNPVDILRDFSSKKENINIITIVFIQSQKVSIYRYLPFLFRNDKVL
jgi:hypothetical protein